MRPSLRAALVVAVMVLAPATATGAALATPLPDPSVRMTPDLLVVGALPETAYVTFDAYVKDVESVQVLLAGVPLEPPLDISGSGASGEVELPERPPCGRQVLEAVWAPYDNETSPRSTSSVVTVQCPALTLSPDELAVANQPADIVWTVTGFVPSSAVALRLGDEPVEVVKTDERGRARFTAPVDDLGCGRHEAAVLDRSTPGLRKERGIPQEVEIVATAVLTVRCPARVDPVEPTDPLPPPSVVQLNPVVVAAGTTTRVTGASFTGGETATLAWVLQDGTTQPAAQVAVSVEGGFVTDVLVLVNSGQGPRELVASTPSGAAASDLALVVAGTTQPGRNGLVNRR